MQDTVKQDRERFIGGSDIPVIMNISPFKTRFNLLLEKAGYKRDTFEGNIYTEYGNTLEPKIREYINKDLDVKFIEGKHTREAAPDEIIGVRIHTDGERLNNNCFEILEIKTTSNIYESLEDYKLYLVQLLFYMINTSARYGRLAVYERPDDLSEDFDPERLQVWAIDIGDYINLVDEIKRSVTLFIEDLKKVYDNPFITEEELLPCEIPDIVSKIVNLEYQLEYEKDRLKSAMIASGRKTLSTSGGYTVSYVAGGEDSVKPKFNEKRFKEANPDLYSEYLEDKIVKGREGYIKISKPKEDSKT